MPFCYGPRGGAASPRSARRARLLDYRIEMEGLRVDNRLSRAPLEIADLLEIKAKPSSPRAQNAAYRRNPASPWSADVNGLPRIPGIGSIGARPGES